MKYKKKGCGLPKFVCACCKKRAGAWNVPVSRKVKKPHVVLCTNANQGSSITPGYLMHELTHFLQVCEKRSGKNCDDYYVNEVEAYKKQGKGLDVALNDALWSVHHTEGCSKDYAVSEEAHIRALKVYND